MRKISVFVIFLIASISYSMAAQTTVIDDSVEMDEINGVQYPIVGVRCSVNGRAGTLYNLGGLSNEEQQWYRGAGRILNCSLGLSVNECYCNLGAPDCFVGNTCGSAHIYDEDYSSSCTPPRVLSGRIVGSGNAPMGLPCNEIGVSCKCEVEKCHGFLSPNPDGTCPELPDDSENENAEAGANVESTTATEPSNGATTSETEHVGSPGCPKYTYRVENNECLPIGGYMDAHIRGNIRWAGRKCTGDILRNYDPNATAGYWTQSIYGHHACPELGADDISGPYVRCACGSSQCKSGYTAHNGHCQQNTIRNTNANVISNASGEESTDDKSDVTVNVQDGTKQVSSDTGHNVNAEEPCAEGLVHFTGIVRDELDIEILGVKLYNNSEVIGRTDDNGKFDVCVPQNTDVTFRFSGNLFSPKTVSVRTEDMPNQNITMTYNGDTQLSTGSGTDTESISALAKTLDEIEDAYGLSKWRTVDGKFNYARLASDATAAVVLGTTGALVTSSVVKKKQVEAGFESLECTVGGQHVGDWGDVFRIDGK